MTIDEAIKDLEYGSKQLEMEIESGLWIKGSESELSCKEGIALNKQYIEWLTKLKELEAKHWDECRQIAHYDDELKEAKRLLKAAVEDLRLVRKCQCCKHQITGYADICYGCHFNTNKWEWRYADEVLSLIGDEPNGI